MSSLIQDTTPFETITIKELHPTFGAEVSGVDFDNLTDEQLAEIIAAMAKYGVCVFRSTGLTDSSHVSFSWKLGSLDNIGRYIGPGRKLRYQHLELFDAGNLDGDNNIISPDSPRAHSNRGNGLFHADSSFNPRRASFSLLRAVTLPPPETGGNTDFADSRTAFDDLPSRIKTQLLESDYVGAHCMAHSRKLGSSEFFAAVDPWKAPMSRHKIVQRHEPSGRYNLYVGTHLHHIEDREGRVVDDSDELVSMLNEHATQPKYVMSVRWEQPGDMAIWDNRCVLHRAGAWSGEGMYARDMRRTTVHDDSPTAWGLNEVGTAMPTMASFSGQAGPPSTQPRPAAVEV